MMIMMNVPNTVFINHVVEEPQDEGDDTNGPPFFHIAAAAGYDGGGPHQGRHHRSLDG